jgi:ubiquinone/menaquinone biosynthesis C-methylase UbiE
MIDVHAHAVATPTERRGLLGDTAARDYSHKLKLFNEFAAPEIRHAIASLPLERGMRVLDAGCGTGETLAWLREAVGPDGMVVGCDLAAMHAKCARSTSLRADLIVQADVLRPPFKEENFDLIWCVNTINHLREPVAGVRHLARLLRPHGRSVLGQSSLLPDMYFAWDARLERVVAEAVRRYYEHRYGLSEQDLTGVRSLVGQLRAAGLRDVTARTIVIERVHPLDPASTRYLLDAIFRNTWGDRLRGYMPQEDFQRLDRLCDPESEEFALNRPDFHCIQSFTMVVGRTDR